MPDLIACVSWAVTALANDNNKAATATKDRLISFSLPPDEFKVPTPSTHPVENPASGKFGQKWGTQFRLFCCAAPADEYSGRALSQTTRQGGHPRINTHASVCTSTDRTDGKSRTMGDQESPASGDK